MFYSNDEFNFQVQELMDTERYSFAEACGIVQTRMDADELEFQEWRDQTAKEVDLNDSWYENQYELDADYI
jgi:hypothetical protein